MTLEQECLQAKDAAKVAAKRAEDAEASLKAKTETVAALEKEKADLTTKAGTLEQENAQLKTDLAARDKSISDLTAKIEATEKDVDHRAGLKAAAQLSKLGIKPLAESTEAGASTGDLWAQYNALQDPKAKREFYLAHQKEM